ncbi:ATP-binding protein, partial [Cyanobium sp. HWJ4-Hawea]
YRSHFPCRVTLVAATNPCPCGWHGDPERLCSCSESIRKRYWAKLSGPLLDRLDLQVVMRRPNSDELAAPYRRSHQEPEGESTSKVAMRVKQARQRMAERNPAGCSNGELASARLSEVIKLSDAALALWEGALNQRQLSARAGERLLRVAQTICDLDGKEQIGPSAIAEALTFRSFDQLTS